LLELIRRLAEDDKDGVMAHKVWWWCPRWNYELCKEPFYSILFCEISVIFLVNVSVIF